MDGKKVCIFPCRKACFNRSSIAESRRSHYHCPKCCKHFGRKHSMNKHLDKCLRSTHDSVIKLVHKTTEDNIKDITEGCYKCKHCAESFTALSSLRRHGEMQHGIAQAELPCITIDAVNGIFLVATSKCGLLAPVHVQKHTAINITTCTDEHCSIVMKESLMENPGLECPHLQCVKFSHFAPHSFELKEQHLEELKALNIITTSSITNALAMFTEAKKNNVPAVVYADFESLGYCSRTKYFSVYTGKRTYFSPLKRTRVTFDSETALWSCPCGGSHLGKICVHEVLAKWYMLQFSRGSFQHSTLSSSKSLETEYADQFSMAYLLKEKMIPETLNKSLLVSTPPPSVFVPEEDCCPACAGELLNFKKQQATVYGLGCVFKGIMSITKKCKQCNVQVRFQEYKSGFHNFNNCIFLSLQLCCYLVKGLKNHIAVERNLKNIFDEENIPYSALRNGMLHFCALREYNYNFSCMKCGSAPSVLVGDGNWSNTCKRPVDAVQTIEEKSSEMVNVTELWEMYAKEIIGRGFHDSASNPWKVNVNYLTVAPWIGEKCRGDGGIPNTEFKKGKHLNVPPTTTSQSSDVCHEDILMALHEPVKNNAKLRALCAKISVSSQGSADDIINRLNELVLFKDIYPKAYKSTKRCAGGILHFRCPHGVCYYFKTLLRQESARDHVDGILAFKVQPKVYVSDIVSQVAHHGDNRKKGLFRPNKGMLYEWTEKNLELHKYKSLPLVGVDTKGDGHYSLYDRFHLKSQKPTAEKCFRDLCHCPDLNINSSAAEQANAVMAKDRYSLCVMNFVNFMFVSRLTMHLHNEETNANFIKDVKRKFGMKMEVAADGIARPVFHDRQLLQISIPAERDVHPAVENTAPIAENKKVPIPPFFDDIRSLWKSVHCNRVEVCIDAWKLDTTALRTLEGNFWLDDIIIDATLAAVVNQTGSSGMFVLSCLYSTTWFWKGCFSDSTRNSLINKVLNEKFCTVINVGGHWVFAEIDMVSGSVYLEDPLGKEYALCSQLERKLRSFCNRFERDVAFQMPR